MPVFKYEGLKKNGEKIKGSVTMPNETEVRVFLRQQGIRPSKIEGENLLNKDLSFSFGSPVSDAEIAIMTRQLSVMVSSGVPLLQAFDILQSGEKNKALQNALKGVGEAISGGSPLWESMSKQKNIFSHLYIYLVRAGEASGSLDIILNRLAKYLDDNVRIVRMIKGAMIYPIAVVVVGIGVTMGLLTFIVPKMADMLTSAGGQLPALTQLVINMSEFVRTYFLHIAGALTGLGVSFSRWKKTEAGKRQWMRIVMKTPIFGDIAIKGATARFTRTLGIMLSSGVNLIDAIEICKMTIENAIIEDALMKVKEEIQGGKTVAAPLASAKVFPPMVIQMINVGESTGTLDQMLIKVAEFYEAEVEVAVGGLTKLIEPVILVVLGGIVAFILIAMYLPVFSMGDAVQ
jgi:type IV pilus assembly protein PilC